MSNVHLRIPNEFVCAGIYFAARLRQTKICNYQHSPDLFGFFHEDYLGWDMIAPGLDELSHVTSLQFTFTFEDAAPINGAEFMLARTPALRSLDLELLRCEDFEDTECCHSAVEIFQDLFRSRIKAGQPTRLRSLRIASMCFMNLGKLLPSIIDLSGLEHLQLIRCIDIDPFLRNLESLHLGLSSLSIEDFHRWHVADFALNDFIRSLKPLKHLTLEFQSIWDFDDRALQLHQPSLEFLRMEDDPWRAAIVPDLRHASNLEQLALCGFNLEDRTLISGRAPYPDVQDLLVSVEMSDLQPYIVPTNHIDCRIPLRT